MVQKILCLVCLFTQCALFADSALADQLERRVWDNIKEQKWDDLERQIAPGFQLALFDGSRNKEQYVHFVKTLNIKDFTFSNFTVTTAPELIIITYDIFILEMIVGEKKMSKSMCQSVWQKNGDGWQQVSHSLFVLL